MSLPFRRRRAGVGLAVFSFSNAEMLRLVLNGDSEVLNKLKFARMIIRDEINGLLLSCDCRNDIGKVTKSLKPTV